MHEHHEACHIIEHAIEAAKERGHSTVKEINLIIGDSSGFSPEAVTMNIEVNAEGTICENAKVNVRTVKTCLKCPNCGELFPKVPFTFDCPHCKTPGVPSDIGKEMAIESIITE